MVGAKGLSPLQNNSLITLDLTSLSSVILKKFLTYNSQSGFGLATALLVLLVISVIVLEFGFGIIERMGGNMLKWSNNTRPQEGRAWDFQSVSISAMQDIGQIVSEQNEIRRDLQSRTDFAALPMQLSEGKILALSREKFLDLYDEIPPVYAHKLGASSLFMELTFVSDWKRVAFIGRNSGLDVYYLNNENIVLMRCFLDENYFHSLQRWGAELPGSLEVHPDFSGRIYSAAEFVYALSFMGNVSEDFYPAREILKEGSNVENVAVSRRWKDGMVDLAFRFSDGRTIIYPVSDNFASSLMEYLPDSNVSYEADEQ